jgi:hypothetical protein
VTAVLRRLSESKDLMHSARKSERRVRRENLSYYELQKFIEPTSSFQLGRATFPAQA